MRATSFDDLLVQKGTASTERISTAPRVLGSPIDASEVAERLSAPLYEQLSDGDDASTLRSVARAEIHASAILGRLGFDLDLDAKVIREIVLLLSIYEMHLALGREEAGREYRLKAKDMIIAAYGAYPEAEKNEGGAPVAAITVPRRKPYPRAHR